MHDLLAGATGTGGKQLVPADLSRALGALRVHSKATNPQYTDNLINKFVGSTKCVSPRPFPPPRFFAHIIVLLY